jgi:hypothetical protein
MEIGGLGACRIARGWKGVFAGYKIQRKARGICFKRQDFGDPRMG